MQKNKSKNGFSLFEIIIVCSIIAVILAGTTLFFNSTRNTAKLTQAVQDIKDIREGAAEWVIGQPDYNGNGVPISYSVLASAGLLPISLTNQNGADPWGGIYTISSASGGSQLMIQVPGMPTAACQALQTMLSKQVAPSPAAQCQNGIYTAYFN